MADPMIGEGGGARRATTFPETGEGRKQRPVASGVLDYFPDAIVALAAVSFKGNEQHNPGKPLFWNRGKSGDEADALMRHFLQRGTVDTDGIRHSAKVAWRALALLQKEIEGASRIDAETLPACPYIPEAVPTVVVGSDNEPPREACQCDMCRVDPGPEVFAYYPPDGGPDLVFNQIEGEAGEEPESGTVVANGDLDACGTIDGVTPIPAETPDPEAVTTDFHIFQNIPDAPEGYYIDTVEVVDREYDRVTYRKFK